MYVKDCGITHAHVVVPTLNLDAKATCIFLVIFHCCRLRVLGRLT